MPEDLFMNRGLYEASALSSDAACRKARSFYEERYAKGKMRSHLPGFRETLGYASILSLLNGAPDTKQSVFDAIDVEQRQREIERRLFQMRSQCAEERTTALWTAVVWKDLGFSAPARSVLVDLLQRHPDDTAARYTLARFYAGGEVVGPRGWHLDQDMRQGSKPSPMDALRESETILQRSPGFYPALWIAGTSAYDLHMKDKARVYLQRYISVGGGNHLRQAEELVRRL